MAKAKNANGMGSYRKKGNRYEWKQMVDGEMKYASAKTPKELAQKVKLIIDIPVIKEKYKVKEWFDKWLSTYIQPLKQTATYEQYKNMYQKHIKPQIGNKKMINISTHDLQSIIATMHKNNLSAWTMKHVRKVLNIAFSRALKEKIIHVNPVKDIEIPSKQQKARKVLSSDELAILFKGLSKSRWIWSVRFLLVTGLRRGELLALKWSDIDFDNKRITVDESNSRHGIKDTKSAKVHYVPLSVMATEYLDKQKDMLEAETNPILWVDKLKQTELIFPSQDGLLMPANSYYTMLSRHAKKVGLNASPHCLRHTFVYLMRDKLTLKDLQNVLGHDESTTTLDIYGDIINNNIEKTAEQIDDVFEKVNAEMKKVKKKGKVIAFPQAK